MAWTLSLVIIWLLISFDAGYMFTSNSTTFQLLPIETTISVVLMSILFTCIWEYMVISRRTGLRPHLGYYVLWGLGRLSFLLSSHTEVYLTSFFRIHCNRYLMCCTLLKACVSFARERPAGWVVAVIVIYIACDSYVRVYQLDQFTSVYSIIEFGVYLIPLVLPQSITARVPKELWFVLTAPKSVITAIFLNATLTRMSIALNAALFQVYRPFSSREIISELLMAFSVACGTFEQLATLGEVTVIE
eukprot:PhF_6_TR25751/c0_g1_i1/m.36307